MPEEIEIETRELQETLHELQEERKEREAEERRTSWTRYIALSTAILAVFAAIGALQSGTLVNEAMMKQLRASDTWAEYQAARSKDHLYTTQANALLDRGAAPPPPSEAAVPDREHAAPEAHRRRAPGRHAPGTGSPATTAEAARPRERAWQPLPPDRRLASYIDQVRKESEKEENLQEKATELEHESEQLMHLHERFAQAVALIQVAIALSAVAALTRIRAIWLLGMAAGLAGIVLFALGFLAHGH